MTTARPPLHQPAPTPEREAMSDQMPEPSQEETPLTAAVAYWRDKAQETERVSNARGWLCADCGCIGDLHNGPGTPCTAVMRVIHKGKVKELRCACEGCIPDEADAREAGDPFIQGFDEAEPSWMDQRAHCAAHPDGHVPTCLYCWVAGAHVRTTDEALQAAVVNACWKATPFGQTEDGDIKAYILPKGAVHRLVGAAQRAGLSASLRAFDSTQEAAEEVHRGEHARHDGWTGVPSTAPDESR